MENVTITDRAKTKQLPGITGVILAGGRSSRMGSNKALLPYRGGRFIEAIHRQLREIFPEVILVTNNPAQYQFLPCSKVPDLFPGMGALAGIHAGLVYSRTERIFTVACDMPYLNSGLIRFIASRPDRYDVVVPESANGLEPLHARYGKGCLPAMEACLAAGRKRIISFYPQVAVECIGVADVAAFDPLLASFSNINTPEDYYRLRDAGQGGPSAVPAVDVTATKPCAAAG
jgi:FdhD protein